MDKIFETTYDLLKWISGITGFTYHEVNIIVYYILIPALFFYLIDRLYKMHYLKIIFAGIVITGLLAIPSFQIFSTQLFEASANFLRGFDLVGLDYVQASVVVCVFIPVLISCFLLFKYYKQTSQKNI